MVVAEIAIIPMGTKTPTVSEYIADAIEVLQKEKNIKYEITPTGTIVEGGLEKVLDLAKEMHESVFGKDVSRAVTIIRIDDRRDKPLTMKGKVRSLKEKL